MYIKKRKIKKEWNRRYRSLSYFVHPLSSSKGKKTLASLCRKEKEEKRSDITYIQKKKKKEYLSFLPSLFPSTRHFQFSPANTFPTPLFHHPSAVSPPTRLTPSPPANNLSASTRTNVFRAVLALHGMTRFESSLPC